MASAGGSSVDDLDETLDASANRASSPSVSPYTVRVRRLTALLRPRPGSVPHRADRARLSEIYLEGSGAERSSEKPRNLSTQ
jgi:hypothetical protein